MLKSNDVVRVISGNCKGKTGVINKVDESNVNVFLKGNYIGIWFQDYELKRIGRVVKKGR